MEDHVYKDMILQQESHWWFRARRQILSRMLDRLALPEDSKILEIGCGVGGNIPLLKNYGDVTAVEMDEFAAKHTSQTYAIKVVQGSLPDDLEIKEQFDLICLFDVLEHIEADQAALERIAALLKDDGRLVLTVPAHQWLFGTHDKFLHHFRRYSKRNLIERLTTAGFFQQKVSYFNFLLFPLVIFARFIDLLKKSEESMGYSKPSAPINSILYGVFQAEKWLLPNFGLPFGASIISISSKNS
jgi:SAM-dependent methyltransferase